MSALDLEIPSDVSERLQVFQFRRFFHFQMYTNFDENEFIYFIYLSVENLIS